MKKQRITALLLSALLLLTPVLSACDTAKPTQDDSKESTATQDAAPPDAEITTPEEQTTEEIPDAPVHYLFENKDMRYTVIYPFAATDDTKSAAASCNLHFYHRVNNPADTPTDDFDTAKETDLEILIGDTNREESATVKAELQGDAYRIRFVGNKLVVVAAREWMLERAVSDLLKNITYIKNGNKIVSATLPQELVLDYTFDGYTRPRWSFSGVPVYDGGLLAEGAYNDGISYQTLEKDAANYSMLCASKTNAAEFDAYLKKLADAGCTVEPTAQTENVRGAWVTAGDKQLYVYYTDGNKEARFILDRDSTTSRELSYTYEKQAGEQTTVYLYGIAMDPDGENNTTLADHKDPDNNGFYGSNCGMSMVIKLADNSVILIDGGGYVQMSEQAANKLNDFLHSITNTPADQKVRVRTWYLSHYHGDHYTGFIRFMVNYHSLYDLESVMFNLRHTHMPKDLKQFFDENLPAYYPNITYHRPHTGERITFADVTLDIMYTFEDLISAKTLSFGSADDNDTSTVSMVTVDGKKFLITGDIYTSAETVLIRNYDKGELDCDVLQIPHHGLNNTTKLFAAASPAISLFTQSEGGAKQANGGSAITVYNSVVAATEGGKANLYFAGNHTVGISVSDGELWVTKTPADATPYPTDEAKQWTAFDLF